MFTRIKDFFKRLYQRPFWHIVLNKYFVVALFFLCYIAFFDNNNIGEWIKTKRKLHNQQEQIYTYKRDIKAIDKKLNQLKNHKDSLEKFAREQYLFVKDSEDLYIVE